MIQDITISNFRCFDELFASNCKLINVIVGDNGAGKTALLEALFLNLAANIDVSLRLKSQRGFDTTFQGNVKEIEEAIWRDYFFQFDWSKPINIALNGTGIHDRNLRMYRGPAELLIPLEAAEKETLSSSTPITFEWQDSGRNVYKSQPKISAKGIQLDVVEGSPPAAYLFGAYQVISATETASRFSRLSREGKGLSFLNALKTEYPWIKDLSIEVIGGLPVVHATTVDSNQKIPINAISGGINRTLSIMLAMAAQDEPIVLVDEIENGLYYSHKTEIWRSILSLSRQNKAQLFLTTHDEEWLKAIADAGNDYADDISLWRLERTASGQRTLRQFSGRSFLDSIAFGGEVR